MPTPYPLSLVLTNTLTQIVANTVISSVNASLANLLAEDTGVPTLTIAQTQVMQGQSSSPGQISLGVEVIDCAENVLMTGYYQAEYTTQIVLLLPSVLNDRPEDFAMVGNVIHDEMRQALNQVAMQNIVPINPDGNRSLPEGISFSGCYLARMIHPPLAIKSANAMQSVQSWRFYHHAEIFYPMTR